MTFAPETRDSLLIRVRDPGDRAAWEEFDAIYRPMVYRIARRAGRQECDAEELSQRVMISVANAIPDWKKDPQKGSFRGWLNRVARNALVSMIRRDLRDALVLAGGLTDSISPGDMSVDETERLIDQEHHRSRLRWAAQQIRHEFHDRSWNAFWLTTLGERSPGEAAEELEMSIGAIYAARSRIMRRLQEHARNHPFTDEAS